MARLAAAGALILLPGSLLAQSDTNHSADAQEVIIDEMVAKVNSDIITLTDLNAELERLRGGLRAASNDTRVFEEQWNRQRPNVLQNMILNRLIMQRAEELGMLADIDREVDQAIQQIMNDNGIPGLDTFKQLLQQQGMVYEDYRRSIREQIVIGRMQQQFIHNKYVILTEEVEAYYQEHIEEFTEPAKVELAEILLLTEGKNAAQVRSRAEDLLARLKAGESFEELARQHSDGNTASRGGNLGSFNKGTMAEKIESAAFSMDAGEISDILELDFGLMIVKVLSRTEAQPKPLAEVRPQIMQALQQIKAEPFMREFLSDLREQSFVWVNPKYRQQYVLDRIL